MSNDSKIRLVIVIKKLLRSLQYQILTIPDFEIFSVCIKPSGMRFGKECFVKNTPIPLIIAIGTSASLPQIIEQMYVLTQKLSCFSEILMWKVKVKKKELLCVI